MKLIQLLCFIGVALATGPPGTVQPGTNRFDWNPRTEYTFEYNGRLLSGLPELVSQYAGVSIKCKVHVKVLSTDLHGEPTRFGFRITDGEYVRVNDRVHGRNREGGDNWRNVELGPYTPVPTEMSTHLYNPFNVDLKTNGEFDHMVVGETEPDWSINLKKGLTSLFQTRFVSTGSSNGEVLSTNSLGGGGDSVTRGGETISWQTSEMSLDGECTTTYQLNELPSWMPKDTPVDIIPNRESCGSGGSTGGRIRYYELTKTRDLNSCSKHTGFSYYKPGFFKCQGTGNCEGMWSRSSITRYTACGTDRDNLNIQTIVNEGELTQNLLGYNSEKFVTGTKQTLKLMSTTTTTTGPTVTIKGGSQVLRTLFYEYGFSGTTTSGSGGSSVYDIETPTSSGVQPWHVTRSGELKSGSRSQIIPQIKKILSEIVDRDLLDLVTLPKKQITMKILTISRGFSLIKKSDIEGIFTEMTGKYSSNGEKKYTVKNIMFDTITMGGSKDCIEFMVEKIRGTISGGGSGTGNDDLSKTQMMSFFMFLPTYVMTPTRELMGSLYDLIKMMKTSSSVSPLVFHHSIMSMTILVERSCIAENRWTSYPTFVFGKFCGPDSPIVTEKWLPFLQDILRETRTETTRTELKNLVIVALGHMSHKNVIPMILPFVEETGSGSTGTTGTTGSDSIRFTRFLSVYSLGKSGLKNPNLVFPVLLSVFTNTAENTEIRLASLNTMLKLNPPMTVIQAIGTSTWHERDIEILTAVNTAFFSLSEQRSEISPLAPTVTSLQRKVRLVYPMIKKTGGRVPSTGTVFGSEKLKTLGVGYEYITSWIGSKNSVLPSDFYKKLVYFLNRYQVTPFEFGFRLRNGETLGHQIVDILTGGGSGTGTGSGNTVEEISEKVKSGLHSEWRKVIETLNIKDRDVSGSTSGSFYMNFYEDSPIFTSFTSESTEMLKEKLGYLLGTGSGPITTGTIKSKVCGSTPVNYQRSHDLTPLEVMIPSDMGLPIIVEMHMPVLTSVRGNLDVDCSTRIPSVKFNFHTVLATQKTAWVGTICPFTKQIVTAGVDEHAVVNVPVETSLTLNTESRKLKVTMRPYSGSSGTGPITSTMDIFHFHVRPYTVSQGYLDLTPMTLSTGVKFMRVSDNGDDEPVKTRTWSFGDMLGLSLKSVITTETRFLDVRALFEKFAMYNYNPLNVIRFGWASTAISETGKPSLRRHELQIKYNPSESSTKEIEFSVDVDVLTKTKTEGIKMHEIKVKTSGSGGKHIIPYEIKKKSVEGSGNSLSHKVGQLLGGVTYGTGVGLKFNLILKSGGSHTRTYSYTTKIVGGSDGRLTGKWNVHLESDTTGEKLCVDGDLTSPVLPTWNIDEILRSNVEFRYKNKIGFGTRSCEDSKITVTGTTQTSQVMKNWVKTHSSAYKLYKDMKTKSVPLTEMSEVADKVRIESSSLDEVDFTVEYENVPRSVMVGSSYVVEFLKSVWWPYIMHTDRPLSGGPIVPTVGGGSGSGEITTTTTIKIRFNPSTLTYDVTIRRPNHGGVVIFEHIRMPYPFGYILPLNGLVSPLKTLTKKLTGKPVYPTCSLDRDYIKTYDNRTTQVKMDDCFHLITGDCSIYKTFTVLGRSTGHGPSGPKEIKAFVYGKTEIKLVPSSSGLELLVNGTKKTPTPYDTQIVDSHGSTIGVYRKTTDGTIEVRTEWVNIRFNGYTLKVETSPLLKNKLCGLCGDYNGQVKADLRGPKKCVFSKPELVTASYRVSLPSKTCSPLQPHIQEGLRRETEHCTKYTEVPTKVVESFKVATGPCISHQHEIIERPSELCFSRRPVVDCSPRCKPTRGTVVPKNVSFTCMPKNRTGRLYAEKVREGKILPELATMKEDFSVSLPLPRTCEPVVTGSGGGRF